MNYASADTTRFYCLSCWTLLFGDHPLYEKRILVSQIAAYKEFEGLKNIIRMKPQARHFIKDLTAAEVAVLPSWFEDPAHVYQGPADNLLDEFPAMKAAGGEGAEMNAQILLKEIGGVSIPTDEPRLSSGPPSLLTQVSLADGNNQIPD